MKEKLQHIHHNIFTGRHSVFIVGGFTVGGTLIARTLWQYLYNYFGLGVTMIVGIAIFVLSGFYMHKFYDLPSEETIENKHERS